VQGGPIGIGLTLTIPTASVIGQADNHGGIQILAAFVSQGHLKHHIENTFARGCIKREPTLRLALLSLFRYSARCGGQSLHREFPHP
jgi:hypothetical protein